MTRAKSGLYLKRIKEPQIVCPVCGFQAWAQRMRTLFELTINYRAAGGSLGFPLLNSYNLETVTDEDIVNILIPMYVKTKAFTEDVELLASSRGIDIEPLLEWAANTLEEHTARRHEALVNGVPKPVPRDFIGPRRPRGRPRKHPKPDQSQVFLKKPLGRPRKGSF